MINTRIKGYTILELLISMVVTSISIAVLFMFFSSLSERYLIFNKNEFKIMNIALFKNSLKRDFYTSDFLSFSSNQLNISLDNKKVTYYFNKNLVVRTLNKQEAIDTFNIRVKNINYLNLEDGNFLKKLSFEVDFLGKGVTLFFSKEYSSAMLINLKFGNGN